MDQLFYVSPSSETPPHLKFFARTTLDLILNKRQSIDVEPPENPQERLSIVRLLLERGANPNLILLKATSYGVLEETALQHCVRSEREDMVRLFIQHGADTKPLHGWLPMHPINPDFERRRLLEEYGCGPRLWDPTESPDALMPIAVAGTMPLVIVGLGTPLNSPPSGLGHTYLSQSPIGRPMPGPNHPPNLALHRLRAP